MTDIERIQALEKVIKDMERGLEIYKNLADTRATWLRKTHKDIVFWQGKFHTLRLENNALRKKVQRIDRESKVSAKALEALVEQVKKDDMEGGGIS